MAQYRRTNRHGLIPPFLGPVQLTARHPVYTGQKPGVIIADPEGGFRPGIRRQRVALGANARPTGIGAVHRGRRGPVLMNLDRAGLLDVGQFDQQALPEVAHAEQGRFGQVAGVVGAGTSEARASSRR